MGSWWKRGCEERPPDSPDAEPATAESGGYRVLTAARRYWVVCLIVIGLTACLWPLVLRDYWILAYSDCRNWLDFARRFGEEFSKSRFPYGYPLYLFTAEWLVGPYLVFLANLPLLSAMALIVWRMSAAASDTAGASPDSSQWKGLPAFILLLGTVPAYSIYLTNPLRDPLAYVFLFGSYLHFIRAVRSERVRRMAVSGALLGLACSVREPSILAAPSFVLYVLVSWRGAAGLPGRLARGAGWFALGFAIAVAPLLLQTYLTTSQLFLPPQAALEGRVVPGVYVSMEHLRRMAPQVIGHFGRYHPALLVGAVAGLFWAVRRRNPELLCLIAASAAVTAIFYTFYWRFHYRYFHLATLFLVVLAGYGIEQFLALLPAWRRRPAFRAAVLLGMAVAASARILGAHSGQPRFQAPHARALAEEVRALVPAEGVLLAPRPLSEAFEILARRVAYPAPFYAGDDADPAAALYAHVARLMDAGTPVFAVERESPEEPLCDTIALRRLFDLARVHTFHASNYNAFAYAPGAFHLYRVEAWTTRRLSIPVEPDPDTTRILQLDVGRTSQVNPGTETVVSGADASFPRRVLRDGVNFIEIPPGFRGSLEVRVEPDGMLPREAHVRIAPLRDPFNMHFAAFSEADHAGRWRGEVLPPSLHTSLPHVYGEAEFVVPVPAPDQGCVVTFWTLRIDKPADGPPREVDFFDGSTLLATATVDRRQDKYFPVRVALPVCTTREERPVRVVLKPEIDSPPDGRHDRTPRSSVAVRDVWVVRLGLDTRAAYVPGDPAEPLLMASGVHSALGRGEGGRPYRWTTGHAVLGLDVTPPGGDMEMAIDYGTEFVQRRGLPMRITVKVNGRSLAEDGPVVSNRVRHATWRATVPASIIARQNCIEILSDPWPKTDGDPEDQWLGIMLFGVRLEPAGQPAADGTAPAEHP